MSNKTTCPACDAHTSAVFMAFNEEEPCPYCGLPAEVADVVLAARARGAETAVLERLARAEQRAANAERRIHELESALRVVRRMADELFPKEGS